MGVGVVRAYEEVSAYISLAVTAILARTMSRG